MTSYEIPRRLGRRTKHPSRRILKTLRGNLERESTKRTISANGELGPLQMVSELDTRRCASEEAVT